jgi:hypothetical protein
MKLHKTILSTIILLSVTACGGGGDGSSSSSVSFGSGSGGTGGGSGNTPPQPALKFTHLNGEFLADETLQRLNIALAEVYRHLAAIALSEPVDAWFDYLQPDSFFRIGAAVGCNADVDVPGIPLVEFRDHDDSNSLSEGDQAVFNYDQCKVHDETEFNELPKSLNGVITITFGANIAVSNNFGSGGSKRLSGTAEFIDYEYEGGLLNWPTGTQDTEVMESGTVAFDATFVGESATQSILASNITFSSPEGLQFASTFDSLGQVKIGFTEIVRDLASAVATENFISITGGTVKSLMRSGEFTFSTVEYSNTAPTNKNSAAPWFNPDKVVANLDEYPKSGAILFEAQNSSMRIIPDLPTPFTGQSNSIVSIVQIDQDGDYIYDEDSEFADPSNWQHMIAGFLILGPYSPQP